MTNGDPNNPPGPYPPAHQGPPNQYGQPPYQQDPYGGQPPVYQEPRTNGYAIASLVLGIVWVCFIGSILALIFGYMGLKQIDTSQGREGGRGMAIAGIVLGWVGVAFLVIYLILLAVGVATFEFRTS